MAKGTETIYDATAELIYAYVAARTRLSEIEDKLHSTVVEAARRYAKIWVTYYKGYGLPHDMKSLDWAIIDNGSNVEIQWEDWWSSGGHDAGSFKFSINFLLDDSQFGEFESELIAKKELAENEKLRVKEEGERKLLASLRAKYEGKAAIARC